MNCCKLTLAGGVIEPKVSFLTLAQLSALGHVRSFAKGSFRAGHLAGFERRDGTFCARRGHRYLCCYALTADLGGGD